MNKTILVTGGAGFIGSAVVRHLMAHTDYNIVNIDKLTYAASPEAVGTAVDHARYTLLQSDICDLESLRRAFAQFQPAAIMHLAAESHVDRSISGPGAFVQSNIVGTYNMLEAAREYWTSLSAGDQKNFRFHHISTDEVFGTLGDTGYFSETSPYQPNSPYSASKASSDHLVRAWHETFGLPVLVTNCSNNYGPWQAPEKLIPVVILSCLNKKPIPVYGEGKNVRDWLFVDDHARALVTVVQKAAPGSTWNIGCHNDVPNLIIIRKICALMDELSPNKTGPKKHEELISFVKDRPGHDFRYAIDPSKIQKELGWEPIADFDTHLRTTVTWYLENQAWCDKALARIKAAH
jgi:dTDP-glucose 4,6-dehydratase